MKKIDHPLTAKTEERAQYLIPGRAPVDVEAEDRIIVEAKAILTQRLRKPGVALSSPMVVRDYLSLEIAGLEYEAFVCLFLDAQNQLISSETLFRGTLTQTSVYPREVLKAALSNNAAAVIFAHNHPSGVAEPSRADESLTRQLKTALALVDVVVLDHIIVAGSTTLSFAERGLI